MVIEKRTDQAALDTPNSGTAFARFAGELVDKLKAPLEVTAKPTSIVLVSGSPATPAVWDLLADQLETLGHHDIVRLALPGLRSPRSSRLSRHR